MFLMSFAVLFTTVCLPKSEKYSMILMNPENVKF